VKTFSSAIIGLGAIGQGYDYDHAGSDLILTHAAGFSHHPGYDLIAGVDPSPTPRHRFEKKYGRPCYENLDALFSQHRPEVISLAVPTPLHFPIFKEVMAYGPRAVLCEKPLATNTPEAREMVSLAASKSCALLVNYLRRFDPGVIELKRILQDKVIGSLYKINLWYTKGLLNNGSHYLDLLLFLLGEAGRVQIIDPGRLWADSDPEPDLLMQIGGIPVYFLALREECFSFGEIIFWGTQGMVRYTERGRVIEIRKAQPDPFYAGYQMLQQEKTTVPSGLGRALWHVLEGLYRHLTLQAPINSDGKSAAETLAVIERCTGLLGGKA
jgi:predicted dehydrogenase